METTYDDAQNRVTTKDRNGFLTRTQTDPLGRVVTVTRAAEADDEAVLETNTYDANGNKVLADRRRRARRRASSTTRPTG